MNKPAINDIYTDYLLASFGFTTATGLSNLLADEVGYDQVTRFLFKQDYTSKDLWQAVKKDGLLKKMSGQ